MSGHLRVEVVVHFQICDVGPSQWRAVEGYSSFVYGDEPVDGVEECGFTGSVETDQAVYARFEREEEVFEDVAAAVAVSDAYVIDRKH